jgi:hypothetical protein
MITSNYSELWYPLQSARSHASAASVVMRVRRPHLMAVKRPALISRYAVVRPMPYALQNSARVNARLRGVAGSSIVAPERAPEGSSDARNLEASAGFVEGRMGSARQSTLWMDPTLKLLVI